MTDTATARARHPRRRAVVLSVLAVPVGAVLAWLGLLVTLYIPTDSWLVWFGPPLLAVAAPVTWAACKRPPSSRVVLIVTGVVALAGLLTLIFFAWLFWQIGQGFENWD